MAGRIHVGVGGWTFDRNPDLDKWAKRATAWATRGDTFVYVISGAKVRSPAAAQALIERISG